MNIPIWVILALASALFFAGRDIFVKKTLSKKYLSVKETMFLEYGLALVLLLVLFFKDIEFMAITDHWHLFLFKGVTVGAATFLHYKLLQDHDISHVSPYLNLSPLILLLLTSSILGENISGIQLLGIGITVAATFFLEANHLTRECFAKDKKFYFIAFLMLLALSFAAIADRLVLQEVNVYTNFSFTAAIILLFVIRRCQFKKAFNVIHKHPYILVAFFLANISTAFVLAAIGHPLAIVSIIIPLRRTSTLFSSLFGGLLFHEKGLARKLGAAAIMIIGVFLMVQ